MRSGGKALDFYSSQVVYLAQTGLVKREIKKVIRPTGLKVLAKLDKNKCALPFRQAEFEVTFGYGIDSHKASVAWLDKHAPKSAFNDITPAAALAAMREGNRDVIDMVTNAVTKHWYEIERSFLPTRGKYS